MNFVRQGFRKLSSDRHTYIHTESIEIISHAASKVVSNSIRIFHSWTLRHRDSLNYKDYLHLGKQMGDRVRVQFPLPDINLINLNPPRPTQSSILLGSVNEDQLWLGRKRQVWFIPLADARGVCR